MKSFTVTGGFEAECVVMAGSVAGEVFHVARTAFGGATLTPIARFFAFSGNLPSHEGFHPHWRVDCFVRKNDLSPDPVILGEQLAAALLGEGVCSEPLWVSWHRTEELGGKAYGEVFDVD